jgi:hypothetical protein
MLQIEIKKSPLHLSPSPGLNGSLNIFIGEIQKDNTCIICLDGGNLIKNNKCSCIYYFHDECIKKIENPTQCILCKRKFNELQNSNSANDNQNNEACCGSIIIFLILLIGIIIGIYSTYTFS